MDLHATTDFFSLAEEKFDFDVSLSPASSREDDDEEEDEVFVGPVCHKEKCISVGVETLAKNSVSSGLSVVEGPSWSPLTGDQLEEICKEAHLLAGQLEGNQQQQPDKKETNGMPTESKDELKEEFLQDSGDKLDIFRKPADVVLSPIKRETFCVQDSPMKELPPAIQKQILKGSGRAGLGVFSNTAKASLSTQPKMTLRGRAGLATGRVLPSKPAAPASSTASLNAAKARAAPAEKITRMPPPSKGSVGMRHSLASHRSSRVSSCDDLSDTGSVASDVSDSSLNSSLQGRRALAPPSKTGLRTLSQAPPPQARRMTDRRNTSSSSSSMSSFNSSLSVSPTGKGKLDASLNSSVSGPCGRLSTSVSRLANSSMNASKTRRSSIYGKAPEPPPTNATTTGTRRSISVQARKPSEADHSKPVRSTPLKRAQPVVPTPLTPAKRVMERTSSVPNVSLASTAKLQIGVRAKPKAFIAPTPTSQLRGLRQSGAVSSPDAPRIMKPKILMSACSIDSLPQKPAIAAPVLLQTPQAGGNRSLQAKMRRNSALPTPVNRRLSAIPTMTPKSLSRPGRLSPSMSRLPASIRRASSWSPNQVDMAAASEEEQVSPPEVQVQLQPFSLEDEEQQAVPVAPKPEMQEMATSPIKVSQENPDPVLEHPETHLEHQHPEGSGDLMQLNSTEDTQTQTHGTKTQEVEVLLVDAPAPALRHEEKLLIDLSNTPDLVRTASVKPSGGQLIDLTSPLIKWSPEDKKENAINDAPLINLSF